MQKALWNNVFGVFRWLMCVYNHNVYLKQRHNDIMCLQFFLSFYGPEKVTTADFTNSIKMADKENRMMIKEEGAEVIYHVFLLHVLFF